MRDIKSILADHYGLDKVSFERMPGFESDNYLVIEDSHKYVFKVYPIEEKKVGLLLAENALLDYLNNSNESKYPSVIKNSAGQGLTEIQDRQIMCRMLSYLEGSIFANVDHDPDLLSSLGSFLGSTSRHLLKFSNASISARDIHWDLNHSLINLSLLHHIKAPEVRRLVHYFLIQFKEHVLPKRYELRQSIVHNDANDYNILVNSGKVTGLIDFGDVAHSSLICDLAVACSYAAAGKEDPIGACCTVLKGYNDQMPLEEIEVELLYYFIAARLCTSLCESWLKKTLGTDTDYALISEKGVTELLFKWLEINPLHAHMEFRRAIGWPELPKKSFGQALTKRAGYISDALSLSYAHPIYMQSAGLQYMYDMKGNAFLDAYNNIMLVGHCHPRVVEAGQQMMAKINTNTRYVYDIMNEYAEKLLSKFPANLSRIFFVNSGSAASDLAIRLARTFTKRNQVVVMQHGYHGNTSLGIDISYYKYAHKGGSGKKDFVIEAALPDGYRGRYGDEGSKYAKDLESRLSNETPAAFIAEPIVGCGGQVPLAPGYLKEVYPLIRRAGGLCISDEVQVGFGRLGEVFWGYEYHAVVPDIVILGKPMCNGHPVGAVVTTDEIAQSFSNGMEFFSSFGGNPVTCAIGLSVLEVLEEEELSICAKDVGQYMKEQIIQLSSDHGNIGDVRGIGLFLGVDFVKDKITKEADTHLAQYVKNELREHHILTGTDGPADNVLKIKPPLCFNRANVDRLIDTMDKLLKKYPNEI